MFKENFKRMTKQRPRSKHGLKCLAKWSFGTLGLFAMYGATVGIVPAVCRHAEDGQLQWLKSSPVALNAIQTYELPAFYLQKVPFARMLFEFSADFWCAAIQAPETT